MPVLPEIEVVDGLPAKALPGFVAHCSALMARAAARMIQEATMEDGDLDECMDVEEVAKRLNCGVDLVRERGQRWGIALVLAESRNGRPTRVVYPRGRVRAFLLETDQRRPIVPP